MNNSTMQRRGLKSWRRKGELKKRSSKRSKELLDKPRSYDKRIKRWRER
jgi:hypothetical protein